MSLQHQVDRRGAACRRHPVAIDDEDRLGQRDLLEFLAEAVLVFPVDRRALAVQQSGHRQRMCGSAEPADDRAPTRLAAQPVDDLLGRGARHVDAAAHHDRVIAGRLGQVAVQREGRTVGTGDAVAAFADQHPAVHILPQHSVRNPQTVDRAGEREHGELVEQHEDETARLQRGGVSFRLSLPIQLSNKPRVRCGTEPAFRGHIQGWQAGISRQIRRLSGSGGYRGFQRLQSHRRWPISNRPRSNSGARR